MSICIVGIIGGVIAYLVGGFPSGIVIGKGIYGVDLREVGSRNIGTANTVRTLGWGPGIVVVALDVLKGCAGVWIMEALMAWLCPDVGTTGHDVLLVIAAAADLIGATKSPYLHFAGGKGAAATAGVISVMLPWTALVMYIAFISMALVTRIISVATLTAAVTLPITTWITMSDHPAYIVFTLLVFALIIYAHRSNIVRLAHGEERKLTVGHHEKKKRNH